MCIRIILALLLWVLLVAPINLFGQATAPATTQSIGAEIKVHSARFGRAAPDGRNQFRNGIGIETNPGTSIQFALRLSNGSILPLRRDAIAVETFIDDTYQDFLPAGR